MFFNYAFIILLSFKFGSYYFNCHLFYLGLFFKLFIFFTNFILVEFFLRFFIIIFLQVFF